MAYPRVLTSDTSKTTVIYLGRGPLLAVTWGWAALSLLKGWAFRWSHPDMFYMWMAAVVAIFGSAMLWFPPRLTLTPQTFSSTTFGLTIFRVLWTDIASMTEYRASRGRALGLRLKPGREAERGARKLNRWDGYDVWVSSRWEVPLDTVGQTAALYWKAQGGSGIIANAISQPDLAQLVTDTPER